ncbi:mannose-1-phosphate guanylyltransferase [Candidatus Sumerlaeota bacterium]|nr:mannose-1-phosphate guanylyltransferase [Candidatus Sumerlaeota bacterium]
MAGGVGERFWPYSRKVRPKQLLKIFSNKSFLEETIERISPLIPRERMFIITNDVIGRAIRAEIPDFPGENIIYEPVGKNTAACIALAEVVTTARFGNPTMVVLTSDHIIRNKEAFLRNIEACCLFAEENEGLVTIGITPTRPETGFGYIEAGEIEKRTPGGVIHRIRKFCEKPGKEQAEKYLETGNFYWNSGMFFWKNSVVRAALNKFLPDMMKGMERYRKSLGTGEEQIVLENVFQEIKSVSIDYGIMEKSDNIYMLRAEFDWDDMGTWNALERHFPKDQKDNLLIGRGLLIDTEGSLIYNAQEGESPFVATYGLKDVLIVVSHDVIMICPKSRAAKLKDLVGEIRKNGLDQYL